MLRNCLKNLKKTPPPKIRTFSQIQKKFEPSITPGQSNGQFELLTKDYFQDYDLFLLKFQHKKLGTRHYHIASSDENNVFSFTFKTIPNDDTGKPHILEHIALCGSEKYPVRDPFFNMIKRSLNTYMNAWTGPDFTGYPFSTINETDFYNLLGVYSDSVFKPRLTKEDFHQEGWRWEFDQPEDPGTDLKIKGVVYNEMKGAYETGAQLFMETLQKELLRGTPYGFDSGGQPKNIPDLTHEDLVAFHREMYHPSNCSFFSYGNFSPLKHQDFIEENYLKNFTKGKRHFIKEKPDLTSPRKVTATMPPQATNVQPGKDSSFGIAFLCSDIDSDPKEILGLNILSYLLFETPNSPFYKEFLETNISSGYAPGYGYENTILNSYFTIGLKDIDSAAIPQIENQIFEVLEKTSKTGFERNLIESALHLIESNSKISKQNFGLQLYQTNLGGINHECDELIKSSFKVTEIINYIRENLSKGFFENLIKKYFLDNERRCHLTLKPDENFMQKLQTEESKKLKQKSENLTEKITKEILQDSQKLKEDQESLQNLDALPTLRTSDIKSQIEPTLYDIEEINGQKVYFFKKPTNGLTHISIKIDLESIDDSLSSYLYLLDQFFTKIGTFEFKYNEFSELVQLNMARLSFNVEYDTPYDDLDEIKAFGVLKMACLDSKLEKATDLLISLLTEPDFKDFEHLSNLIRLESSTAANDVVENAMGYAIEYGVSSGNKSTNFYNSLYNNRFICNIGTNMMKGVSNRFYLEDIEQNLFFILQKIFKKENVTFAVHCGEQTRDEAKLRLNFLTRAIKGVYKRKF